MSGPWGYLAETIATLLIVSVVAWGALYVGRRMGVGRPRGPIQLIAHLPLEARRAVYLVQVGKKIFVLGGSEAGISKLGEVPLPAIVDAAQPPVSGTRE